ncbi:hypothetical protein LX97_01274 [Nonlabens dokdonensis]|jgi:hypothetical protein|uniref:Uncharacterized protein n=1 Tax=Nonlabens dokdonensis TaxID=328515 RepID=A0ABX5Q323_9FLAO|nr:hypothetical protein LX97_01274 [Nonlabens dokdonensis]
MINGNNSYLFSLLTITNYSCFKQISHFKLVKDACQRLRFRKSVQQKKGEPISGLPNIENNLYIIS